MDMRSIRSQSSLWRAYSLQLADNLVAELSQNCQRATARGDPGLVDLSRALKQARKLRKVIRRRAKYARLIEKAFAAVAFVAAVARRVYALLNNCGQCLECPLRVFPRLSPSPAIIC